MPTPLRLLIPMETPAQQAVCALHDQDYAIGGTRRDRAVADVRFLTGLLDTGMDVDRAHRFHAAVRMFGKSHWRSGRYTDEADALPTLPPEAP